LSNILTCVHVISFFICLYIYKILLIGVISCFCRQTRNVYKNVKRKIERGFDFPTCISINKVVHFSPLASDEAVLEEGAWKVLSQEGQQMSLLLKILLQKWP